MLIAGFPAGAFQANCYLLAAHAGAEAVVVDPGQDATERLHALCAEHRLHPVAVLLTHGHLDHTATAAQVCAAADDISAYLHGADEYMLDDPAAGLSPELRGVLQGLDLTGLRPRSVRTLTGVTELQLAGLNFQVDHTPGHTGGSVVYRIASDGDRPEVLLTGDTLFAGTVGRTDLPGGSYQQLLESVAGKLLSRPDDAVVLPGHGLSSTIGAERVGNPFLAGLGSQAAHPSAASGSG